MAKYWKTTVTTIVLSEGEKPPHYEGLSEVAYDIVEGESSGKVTYDSAEVTEEQMRELLIEQGSAPAFLIDSDRDF